MNAIQQVSKKLIVSCQAPTDSPLHDPYVISAMAKAAINQGAAGVRIDTPAHVQAVRERLGVGVPVIGLWKQFLPGYEVYITPLFEHAQAIAEAGADIIAVDATQRIRPEKLDFLIKQIHDQLGLPVMADVDTIESAMAAVDAGADLVGTTLYGYTEQTKNFSPPGLDLLVEMVEKLKVPVICEGGISRPVQAKQALDLGAYAVVVGGAITGIDILVKAYQSCLSIGD
ncbi:MAG TPA: N-acetylmannosamine-6-phosphate 2-epimerase [Halomicronema sp.]